MNTFRRLRQYWRYIVFGLLLSGFAGPTSLWAQTSNTQSWFEYMLNYPFASSFNLENAFVYSTTLTSPRWAAFDYSPTLEYSVLSFVDLMAGGTLSYTNQLESYNTFEARAMIGTRIFITPNSRVVTRLLLRYEQRNLKNLSTDEWETTYRPRARAEVLVPINRKTLHEDKLWYAIADAEVFLATDDDVHERFANRFRVRIGAGYRLSYSSRFELIYMNQQSKSGIAEGFESTDNIFRLRFKHYLHKTKPTKMLGTGN